MIWKGEKPMIWIEDVREIKKSKEEATSQDFARYEKEHRSKNEYSLEQPYLSTKKQENQ